MTEVKRVKIQNFVETQIPEFLNVDNPLFKEFLSQYYASVEHQTGIVDLTSNLNYYKNIENFNYETFYSQLSPHTLTQEVEPYHTEINVNHTIGFPDKYGLLKIENEIITYTSKTDTTFEGCIRGFSGIDNINTNKNFSFSTTNAEFHQSGTLVENLNVKFFSEIFKKFKYQFLPGFENRDFVSGINFQTILSRVKDFYTSKGTDSSYKLLFKVLFNEDVEIIKPQEYMLRPSDNTYFITKNILVEKVLGNGDPLELKGYTLFQNTKDGLANAVIYNVEVRPIENGKILYEISLDPSSFELDFISTKKTKVLENTSSGTNVITVDSTVGFSTTSLLVDSVNSPSPFFISYEEKTINQFLNTSGVLVDLEVNDSIIENNFAYVDYGVTSLQFRILNVIESVDYSNTFGMRVGDKINLSTFGSTLNDSPYFSKWIYNIPTEHKIKSISATSQPSRKRIEFFDSVPFIKNQKVKLFNSQNANSVEKTGTILTIIGNNTVEIQSNENISNIDTVSKIIRKSNVLSYPQVNNLVSNIQNTYIDSTYENLYVASSGFPDYQVAADNRKILVSTPNNPNPNSGIANTTILVTNKVHKYYTGEKIWLTESNNLGISTGTYFVTTVGTYADSNKISLSYSNSDIFSKKYVNVSYGATGEFVKLDYEYKTLEHQKLLKKFKISNLDSVTDINGDKSTNNKPIGMLLNGVEIYSSTLFDENIFYGKLESIDITNNGSGYDVVNTPEISIIDEINGIEYGTGAKAHLVLTGNVNSIKIVNPGSGYANDIKVSITGGNGYGASLEPIVIKDRISSGFRGDGTGVNPTSNSIIFTSPHNFEDGEIVEYDANSNVEIEYSDPIIRLVEGIETVIGGQIRKLSDNSFYFAGVISDTIIKLYRTKEDCANRVNEINLTTSPSFGFHYFKSISSKNKLIGVSVKESGINYSNRRVLIPSIEDNFESQNGLNLSENYIFAKGHGFKDKDLVIYETTGTEISGISTNNKYYIKVVDENKFKLALAGSGADINDENYNLQKYIRFKSIGSGTHKFAYPPIEIQIEASLESSNGKLVLPTIEPIVLGKVENVFLEDGGERYGTNNIINYHRRPLVSIGNITSEAIFKPIVVDGKIVDVQILNYGFGYGKDIDIVITGSGNFADIYPVVENGRITSVNVINGGIGYDSSTTITVKTRGANAKFLANIFQWKINQIEKNKYLLDGSDEGILVPSNNQQDGLQFVHFYPPKVFRYNLNDSINEDDTESFNPRISPILGWSYDGFPIYGPYQSINGSIQRVKSSYKKEVELNSNLRPTGAMFPEGFFIQDYKYDSLIGDLDEYNGKYVVNDDFPNGTYAYFFTIDIDVSNKSIPQYPYVVSDNFKSHYTKDNYEPSFNQNLDLKNLGLIRNTSPYYLNSSTSEYKLIDKVSDKYKQDFIVKSISSSGIDDVFIYQPGNNYKVGDVVNFGGVDEGTGVYASISELQGTDIDSFNVGVSTSYPVKFSKYGNRIVGTYTTSHNILNNDTIVVSNISDPNYRFLEGVKKVAVSDKVVGISTDILDVGITGSVTIIYPNDITGFEVDDLILIDQELFKIIEILEELSGLRVQRLSNSGFHTAGLSKINLLPRKFAFFESQSKSTLLENTKIYFNPETVIAVGSSSKQYTKLNSSIVNIPQKSIYLPNHNYFTGQPLTYNVGSGGTGIYVSNDGSSSFQLLDNQTLYAVNLGVHFLGISTVGFTSSVGIGTTNHSLYFSNPVIGIGELHSFATQYYEVTGNVENYSITINTKSPHKLKNGDLVTLNVTPRLSKTIKFRFDSQIRKITTDLISFDASNVDVTKSEIEINDSDLETGDKIVYYSNGNPTIGGLVDNETYFVIKTSPGKMQLANYYADAISGNSVSLSSSGFGNQNIAKLNPKIKIVYGSYLKFDLSDSSLLDVKLSLYTDSTFNRELETYKYVSNSGERYIDTISNIYPREIYYNFSKLNQKIYPDYEVKDFNLIEIEPSDYNGSFDVQTLDADTFKVNLKSKPEDLSYTLNNTSTLKYTTKSTNAEGPIEKIKINSSGRGYKISPLAKSISSSFGKNAIIQTKSKTIGKISSLDRIKDGFDYPTDSTLIPVLSVPAIVQVEGISRVDYVGIVTGGINYNTKPTLKVIGNDDIILDPVLDGSSIVDVNIIQNTSNLSESLRIVPTRNSNGYSISDITVNGTDVTLELLNSDNQIYPLITTGYGTTEIAFPFSIGDEIFIERCRIDLTEVDGNGDIIARDNYNSSDYNYQFFTVSGISTENYTVTYSVNGITNNLGNYVPDFGYGYVINRKDMAEFEMFISNDLEYLSEEVVLGYNSSGVNIFSAKVMKNGWNNNINELRLLDVSGTLSVGDRLVGQRSRLNGVVTDVNLFNLNTKLGVSRDKLNDLGDRVGYLNDFQQRISDNNYYQKFSYSVKGKVPYNIWKEPVKSSIHPSGFKEFSDLMVVGISTASMKVGTASSLDLTVNIDSIQSLYTKNNFAMVTEEDQFDDGSIERIAFEEGIILKPYILSKSNKITLMDDISPQFTGTNNLEIIANKDVTFISTDLYQLGVSTSGLLVGDKIGYSTYHFYPDSTYILSIGEGYVGISTYTPHRLYSINGVSTSITQNLDFYRRIPGDVIVGISSFKLTNSGYPLFYREFDASNGITTTVNLSSNSFTIENHNFYTGQKITYTPEYKQYSAIASTTVGSGAILEPVFVGVGNSISKIKVISGGNGYDPINKPTIQILGTKSPLANATFNPLIESITGIITSVEVIDPGYGYFLDALGEIGIVTTTESEGRKDIIMAVSGGIGSAIYENGYNVSITNGVSGISSAITPNFSGYQNRFWGFGSPYIPVKSTSGSGVDAKFSVFIVYNSTTGNPISTSIILRDGGRNYSVGDSVSIAGTYMGGSTPTNDLSFVVSKVSSTRITSEANAIYSNIAADSTVGYGTGALLDITRDSDGDISNVEVIFGGSNYELTDNISIAGTYIGGVTPGDNLYLSPTVLGTDKLPRTLYVERINDFNFKVAGLSTGTILDLDSLGVGTHSFSIENPNVNSIISIDNIIQSPIYKKPIELTLSQKINYNDTIIYVNSGISSVVLNDILIIDSEYMLVKNVAVAGTNDIVVERATLGTVKDIHDIDSTIFLSSGNYNIINNTIYFASPPYGPTGLDGLKINSSFSGRAFSRRSDPFISNDENIIFDDISGQFTGIAATEFVLKSNNSAVVGIFTNTNSITGSSGGVDINNNPIILINNIPQIGGEDYVIDTPGQNTIRFISGVPLAGKITEVGVTTGYGYLPLVGASATVSVSDAGTISNVYLTGFGKGYRTPPIVSLASTVGFGATIVASIGSGGTVTSLTIVNPGYGYTTSLVPEVRVDLPQNYYNLPLEYATGYSGIGTGAKISVLVGNGSSIVSFNLDEPGTAYKVGDVLTAPGISTDPNASTFEEFRVTVLKTYTDSFSGWYPGQFIQFDNISQYFNGTKRRFTLTVTTNGQKEVLSLKASEGMSITNNLFVFVNDILQVPNDSYTFTGTRIIFKEAPKRGSKCNILFFKGSDLDVEQTEPILTLKEGDIVQIDENINDPFDIPQFDRVVKDIFATDLLDTFTYDSLGISTNPTKIRPLNWTKQTQDKVINGVLYSKSRPSLKSRVIPSSKVIKDIAKTDTKIYVDSAIPLFSDLDENRNLSENLRDIIILNNREIISPRVTTNVSTSSTISSLNIVTSGEGYINVLNPTVSISSKFITRKDPIYQWSENVGVASTLTFNSIGYGTAYVSVGNSGLNAVSYDGESWSKGTETFSGRNINDVIGYSNNYIAVGDVGSVYKSTNLSDETIWESINLLTATKDILGRLTIEPSDYSGNFNKVSYNPTNDVLVAVGSSGGLFTAPGITTTAMFENLILSFDFNSVTHNNDRFVVVGDVGSILYSQDGEVWSAVSSKATLQNLNDIIWDGTKFISVGNNGTIITSVNGINWTSVTLNNLSVNIFKINYHNGLYTIIDSSGNLYFSLNLSDWVSRYFIGSGTITDIFSIGNDDDEKYVSIGSSGSIYYSTPIINEASAISTTTNESLSSITVINGGFGYSTQITTPVIIETDVAETEKIYSIKAKGDYGTITNVEVFDTGNIGFGTTSPAILFTLKSDNYPVLIPSMEYTQLEVGDYFIISNSNVKCGHALTGITTSLGGMSNYPASKVGTATSYIDGIYMVEGVTKSVLGVTTVRCHFAPIPAIGADIIQVNVGENTFGFYGNYSFGVIYDYQNRSRETPKSFSVNKDDGLVGIQTGPMIYRTRGLI